MYSDSWFSFVRTSSTLVVAKTFFLYVAGTTCPDTPEAKLRLEKTEESQWQKHDEIVLTEEFNSALDHSVVAPLPVENIVE